MFRISFFWNKQFYYEIHDERIKLEPFEPITKKELLTVTYEFDSAISKISNNIPLNLAKNLILNSKDA